VQTLEEWNVELALLISHDKCGAYEMRAGIYRRVCSSRLVMSETSFEAIRFRHAGLVADEVVTASFWLLDFVPRVGELANRFHSLIHQGALDFLEGLAFGFGQPQPDEQKPEKTDAGIHPKTLRQAQALIHLRKSLRKQEIAQP